MRNEKVYSWPKWTAQLLSAEQQKKVSQADIAKLNKAQILIWQALNIYDDFFDGEGKKEDLPIANSYSRVFIQTFYNLELSNNFYLLLDCLFANIDKTNRQEILQNKLKIDNGSIIIPKKLPDFSKPENLSKKSLVLALAPLAIMDLASQTKIKTSAVNNNSNYLLNFFKYALSAKQLSDDAKDWLDDLKNGQINSVNILILKEAQKKKIELNLNKPQKLYLLFLGQAALPSGQKISELCAKARTEIKKITLSNDKLTQKIIKPLESAANKAKRFYDNIS